MGLMPVPRRRRQPGLRPQGDRRRTRQLGERPRPAPGRGAPARRHHRAADRDSQRLADHRDPHRRGVGSRDEAARAAGLAHRRDPRLRRAGTLARRRHADGARRSDHPDLEPQRRSRRGARARDALARRRGRSRRRSTGADVVCTATSSSEPLVELEWLAPGTHINAAGAFPDGKSRELSTATVAASRFFVDRRESTLNEAGDYRVAAAESGFGPEHIVGELGELLNGTVEGRRSDDELTVFKSMGIAVEDLAAAQLCVARARERGVGVEVDF